MTQLPTELSLPALAALVACSSLLVAPADAQTVPSKQAVSTAAAPPAIGPYSQAIKYGDTLYLSGQIAIDPKTNQVMAAASIEEQTTLVLDNLKAVLAANGMTLADVVSTLVLMKDLNEFAKMNTVYGSYFKDTPPARATFEAARLPRDVRIEITATARK
jgi:2-iminobutanoate/2-iminopropanoate deaminase